MKDEFDELDKLKDEFYEFDKLNCKFGELDKLNGNYHCLKAELNELICYNGQLWQLT